MHKLKRVGVITTISILVVSCLSACGVSQEQVEWSDEVVDKIFTTFNIVDATESSSKKELRKDKESASITYTYTTKDDDVNYAVQVITNDKLSEVEVGSGWGINNLTRTQYNCSLAVGKLSSFLDTVSEDKFVVFDGYHEDYYFKYTDGKLTLVGYNIYNDDSNLIETYLSTWDEPTVLNNWVDTPYSIKRYIKAGVK